jgi:glycerophosphoryl diester phosphodiesterase
MRRGRIALLQASIAIVAVCACAAPAAARDAPGGRGHADHNRGDHGPIVIGHRGAAGYLPDHTLAGYRLAIRRGADYVEPDLVATKDGVLVARHEPNIKDTTDVASHPEFADRRRHQILDGVDDEGWFVSDFTFNELETLRAVQPLPERSQRFNRRFRIPSFAQIIRLVKRESRREHRTIGIYPETKHPTYHNSIGLPLEGRLVRALRRAHLDRRNSPVFIQSFEQSSLKQLNRMIDVPLIQLMDANDVNPDGTLDFTKPFDRPFDWTASGDPALLARTFAFFATDAGLDEVATYADGIGPWKRYIMSTAAVDSNHDGTVGDENGDGNIDEADRVLLPPTDLIQRAHQRGLLVHTWTFRNEPRRLAADYRNIPIEEYLQFYELGIDGVFSDFADTAVTARELLDPGED